MTLEAMYALAFLHFGGPEQEEPGVAFVLRGLGDRQRKYWVRGTDSPLTTWSWAHGCRRGSARFEEAERNALKSASKPANVCWGKLIRRPSWPWEPWDTSMPCSICTDKAEAPLVRGRGVREQRLWAKAMPGCFNTWLCLAVSICCKANTAKPGNSVWMYATTAKTNLWRELLLLSEVQHSRSCVSALCRNRERNLRGGVGRKWRGWLGPMTATGVYAQAS